jgi:hypothetical protein
MSKFITDRSKFPKAEKQAITANFLDEMHSEKISGEFQKQYYSIIDAGRKLAQDSTVAIVSISRNSAESVGSCLNFLSDNIEPLFKKVYFYTFENDSEDNTVEVLKQWASERDNAKIESETRGTPYLPLSTSKVRTENMAYARNKCQDYVKSLQDKVDYVIVIDTDFMDFSINGFINSMGWLAYNNNLDAVAGFSFLYKRMQFTEGYLSKNIMLTNYDSWAYRINHWSDVQGQGMMYWFQWWLPIPGSPPIKVNSAFGGCCIYKADKYLSGRYNGSDCEHVALHGDILVNNESQFNLFANPSMVMYVGVEL